MSSSGIIIKDWTLQNRYCFKYAHVKRDGHYTTFRRVADSVEILSSQGTELFNALWHPATKCAQKLPIGCIVAGEFWTPGKPASYTKTAIVQQDPALRFSAFALLRYMTPTYDRFLTPVECSRLPLEHVKEICEAYGFDFVPFLTIANTTTNDQLMAACKTLRLADTDAEGFVLKNGNLIDWHKLKPSKTIDLIITGYVAGAGKYAGKIGSLIVSTIEGYELAAVGGMSDVDRDIFTHNRQHYIGSIVEVEYQRHDAKGRLRHPRFIRLRDATDKDVARCTLQQDSELAEFWRTSLLFGK